MNTPADPLREALPQILRDAYENALDGQSGWPWVEVAHAAINALAAKPADPPAQAGDFGLQTYGSTMALKDGSVISGPALTLRKAGEAVQPAELIDAALAAKPAEPARRANYLDRAGVIEKIEEALPKVGEPEAWCMLHATDLRWIKYELEDCEQTYLGHPTKPADPLRERLTAFLADAVEYKREWVPVSLQTLRAIIAALSAEQAASAPR